MPSWQMQAHEVDRPTTDHEYFERMSRVILASGLNWRTVEQKWPGIKQAFAHFDINAVARFEQPEIDALMANPDVIRNLPKIRAIVANAAAFQAIIKEHGSFARYLAELRRSGGEAGLREAVSRRFAFLGKGTTVIYLFSVGEDLPAAAREWEARHCDA
jgi:3-methyladenine DNA glycosylase Tag